MKVNVRNLVKVYDQATKAEIEAGLTWYLEAHAEASILHKKYVVGAAVIAATSPGLKWERNVETARRVIDGESLEGLGVRWYDGVRKAERIIAGESPLDVLRGNKVRNFYLCIKNPRDRMAVCIDGHAYSIWCGRRISTKDTPAINDRMYASISDDYREAADTLGMLPMQLQAIVWLVWRRIHIDKGQLRLF